MLQRLALSFAIACLIVVIAAETDEDRPQRLLLRGQVIDTTVLAPIEANLQLDANESPQPFVVQFSRRVKPETKEAVRELVGHDLTWYIPHHAFVVYTTTATMARIQSLDGVIWTGVWRPEYKYIDEANDFTTLETNSMEPFRLAVILSPFVDPAVAADDLQKHALDEINCRFQAAAFSRNRIIVENFVLDGNEVQTSAQKSLIYDWLAKQTVIYQISAYDSVTLTNFWAKSLTQDDDPSGRNESELLFARHGIFGENQVVGIGDSGIAESSCFFHDDQHSLNVTTIYPGSPQPMTPIIGSHRKLIQYVNSKNVGDGIDASGHGTHVAGTIAGQLLGSDPNGFASLNGAAPRARIAFFDMQDSTGLHVPMPLDEAFFPFAYAAGARVHSNSWGGISGWNHYTIASQDVDQFVYDHPDMLIVFAAGNNADYGISPPATAKNVIAVGSTVSSKTMLTTTFCSGAFEDDNQCYWRAYYTGNSPQDHVSYFSSAGPTYDGRIKPDLLASGEFLVSAGLSCNGSASTDLQVMQGTSMATPNVAGHMLLVREYLIRGFLKTGVSDPSSALYPSAALLKAIAIAGSYSVGLRERYTNGYYTPRVLNAAPDSTQGFGRLKLNKILYFADQAGSDRVFIPRGVNGADPIISQDEVHSYCFRTTNISEAPRFTLVWTDVPAQPIAAVSLVQDLDLVAFASSVTYFPNGGSGPDSLNTVERVQMPNTIGKGVPIKAQVLGTFLPVNAMQAYAFVASGPIVEISCDNVPGESPRRGSSSPKTGDQLYTSGSQGRISSRIAWAYLPLLLLALMA